MARYTFYYNLKQLGQPDGYDDMRHRIQNIYARHHGRYGYRRITAHLHNEGAEINHKAVQKLMMQMNLKAKRRKQHYRSEVFLYTFVPKLPQRIGEESAKNLKRQLSHFYPVSLRPQKMTNDTILQPSYLICLSSNKAIVTIKVVRHIAIHSVSHSIPCFALIVPIIISSVIAIIIIVIVASK